MLYGLHVARIGRMTDVAATVWTKVHVDALLRVNSQGRIEAATPEARQLLGPCVGARCADVVRAADHRGRGVCTASCATELARGVVPARDRRGAIVRRRRARLVCQQLGDDAVVVITPASGPPDQILVEPLTPRERSVLSLVARGLTNRHIARSLGISQATVRTHIEHARGKLDATTRAQAVATAIWTGQLEG